MCHIFKFTHEKLSSSKSAKGHIIYPSGSTYICVFKKTGKSESTTAVKVKKFRL